MIEAQNLGGPGGGQFLSRVDTGQPSDTTMSTALNMGNNPISNAASVNVNATIFSERQIDSNRYVWSREGLYTEGNIRSRRDIGTDGNIWVPNGAVFAGNFCNANNTRCVFGSPMTCTRTVTQTGGGSAMGNTCVGGSWPPPACPAGFQDMGETQRHCATTSSGNPIMAWQRHCERIACGG